MNLIYGTGDTPQDWLKSIFTPVPEKANSLRCNVLRLISLMSHAEKIVLKIILIVYFRNENQIEVVNIIIITD